MTKKLLHRTLRIYSLYSLLILVLVAPLFYFAIQKLYVKEADDTLLLHKKEFVQYTAPFLLTADIPAWNKYNRNTEILSATAINKDSIYGTTYYDSLDAEIEPYRELQAPVTIDGQPFTYISKASLVEVEDIIKNIVLLFILVIVLLLAGLFLITRKMSKTIWKPFYSTLSKIEHFEIDKNIYLEFAVTEIEEFGRLNSSIENLLRKNVAIYNSQREFVENAAHELQTPLAVLQAKIENFLQRTDVTKEQSEILQSLTDSIARLNKLNKNLLLLGRLDSEIFSSRQSLFMSSIIYKNLEFFTEQANAKQIEIDISILEDCEIVAHPELVEMMVNNLFINAIQHNIKAGVIKIELVNRQLMLSNTSSSLGLNSSKLFNRFSKINSSQKGNGLGLSIIKKIVDLNEWTIRYQHEGNLHSFSVKV